jgi:type VI secretion system protein ImpB
MSKCERVNIDISTHTKGAKKQVSLPMNILVLSKIANNDMMVRKISKRTANNVLKSIKPKLEYVVDSMFQTTKTVPVTLEFKEIKDFRAEHVALNVSEIKFLLGLRNTLKLIKDKSLTNKDFISELFMYKQKG